MVRIDDTNALIYIAKNLRRSDRDEFDASFRGLSEMLWSLLPESYRFAQFARIFHHLHRPAAFFMAHETGGRTLQVSLMATDDWPHVYRQVVRWGLREFKPKALRQGYKRAECRMMDGHEAAQRLLLRLGFVCELRLEDYGERGEAFLQFAWRLRDHVLFQDAETTGAAAHPST